MPHRERYLFVCTNRRADDDPKGSCAHKGSEEIVKQLKAKLKEKGYANRVRACSASCLDLCEVGAAIAVEPDHVVYGRVKLSDVDEIVESIAKGEIVDHLVVAK
jgi:(2Fe-2S) ferredoxin